MYSVALRGQWLVQCFSCFPGIARSLCARSYFGDGVDDGFISIDGSFNGDWKSPEIDFPNKRPALENNHENIHGGISMEGGVFQKCEKRC